MASKPTPEELKLQAEVFQAFHEKLDTFDAERMRSREEVGDTLPGIQRWGGYGKKHVLAHVEEKHPDLYRRSKRHLSLFWGRFTRCPPTSGVIQDTRPMGRPVQLGRYCSGGWASRRLGLEQRKSEDRQDLAADYDTEKRNAQHAMVTAALLEPWSPAAVLRARTYFLLLRERGVDGFIEHGLPTDNEILVRVAMTALESG